MWSTNYRGDWILMTSRVESTPISALNSHLSPVYTNQLFGFTRMPTLRWNLLCSIFIRVFLQSVSMGREHEKQAWTKGVALQTQPLPDPWRTLELKCSIAVALCGAEMDRPLCSCLHQSLDMSHFYKGMTLSKVALCSWGHPWKRWHLKSIS